MTEFFRKQRAKKSKGKKGFSLIELIIVIAIMAIMAGVLGGLLGNSVQNAEKEKERSNAALVGGLLGQAVSWQSLNATDYGYLQIGAAAPAKITNTTSGTFGLTADGLAFLTASIQGGVKAGDVKDIIIEKGAIKGFNFLAADYQYTADGLSSGKYTPPSGT